MNTPAIIDAQRQARQDAEEGTRSGYLDKLLGHYSRYAAYGNSAYSQAYRKAHQEGRNL